MAWIMLHAAVCKADPGFAISGTLFMFMSVDDGGAFSGSASRLTSKKGTFPRTPFNARENVYISVLKAELPVANIANICYNYLLGTTLCVHRMCVRTQGWVSTRLAPLPAML